MATRLGELDSHVDFDLYLPIDGVLYRIPAPTYKAAERLRKLPWMSHKQLPANKELREIERVLGPALIEMRDNSVSAPRVYHAGRTAVIHFAFPQGPEMGRLHWMLGDLNARVDFRSMMKLLAEGVDPSAVAELFAAQRDPVGV